eukprot:TRINITY_DN10288_c0_g1_i6.p2 TRINITY_DN10288_c0_g1~~TRINITY_DN10288_c0_g1_i6.p2  ORF type:complete len:296 (-),score=35.04 TRINITY_DN10288_c0_g1_i6:257-1066(-)
MYRKQFRNEQGGQIGLALNCEWFENLEPAQTPTSFNASERMLEFMLGWFADPVCFGQYPESMVSTLGDKLPEFTPQQQKLLKGSIDFFGLNHYATYAVRSKKATQIDNQQNQQDQIGYFLDVGVEQILLPNSRLSSVGWPIYPQGMRKILNWIKDRYQPVGGIIILENGVALPEEDQGQGVNDVERIKYIHDYLKQVQISIRDDGVDCRGYFHWSLMDNFEWSYGYSKRFGLIRVNYENQERVEKTSAKFYSQIIRNNGFYNGYGGDQV